MDERIPFKVGEVVRLKSGGPDMTVAEVGGIDPDDVMCQWFGGKKLETGVFPWKSLVYCDQAQ
jgi:uncharacterized protein YodC (DUF2158 family)